MADHSAKVGFGLSTSQIVSSDFTPCVWWQNGPRICRNNLVGSTTGVWAELQTDKTIEWSIMTCWFPLKMLKLIRIQSSSGQRPSKQTTNLHNFVSFLLSHNLLLFFCLRPTPPSVTEEHNLNSFQTSRHVVMKVFVCLRQSHTSSII